MVDERHLVGSIRSSMPCSVSRTSRVSQTHLAALLGLVLVALDRRRLEVDLERQVANDAFGRLGHLDELLRAEPAVDVTALAHDRVFGPARSVKLAEQRRTRRGRRGT